jgi:hypothetical protein
VYLRFGSLATVQLPPLARSLSSELRFANTGSQARRVTFELGFTDYSKPERGRKTLALTTGWGWCLIRFA